MKSNNMNLQEIAQDIRDVIEEKRKDLGLEFFEDEHKYLMKDLNGIIRENFPSVSKVLKHFYTEFPTEEAALKKAGGDYLEAERLMGEWAQAGKDSTNLGSRVHYFLEKELISRYGSYKEVRQPVFECDIFAQAKSDSMIRAGHTYLDLCDNRNLVLLDTEMVLGHPKLGYTGQPDKVWLTYNATGNEFGLLITDWKSNKEKNFQVNSYTKGMLHPFEEYPDNALGHYYLQLPFYGKLLIKMLEGTKYEGIKLLGCIVVLLKDTMEYEEFRVPKPIIETIMNMDMSLVLKK
jgi:hypothetical protein